ncbi:DJ-1/PfpI family protein [Oceanospirillum sediminis]|uniref:DJ-1/PfpI family protein n=1 Tax=Oceanospirillum sediminis TaxID=2760088 RepID=A0A839IT77_9GAMM|nr:DJ-1/PfpI family protein [Oceanospirillum sediminis]MBB1487637.1 DJ-1/PfpI family protein [Oceanospirillum sediminis]
MHISIVTLDQFNELDSFIALGLLGRVQGEQWKISIASPTDTVTSMNGVEIRRHIPLEQVIETDAVILGSGLQTRAFIEDKTQLSRLALDPNRQIIGSQCSGALILLALGVLSDQPVCTDLTTRPYAERFGNSIMEQAFFARSNIASAGGCLASQYLAFWMIARLKGVQQACEALHYMAPVGEKEQWIEQAMQVVSPYL